MGNSEIPIERMERYKLSRFNFRDRIFSDLSFPDTLLASGWEVKEADAAFTENPIEKSR